MLKISSVNYLNTIPFNYGIKNHFSGVSYSLELDYPALCAQKFLDREVDIALVPVGSFLTLDDYKPITDYCIGANGAVKSVMLYSYTPLNKIKKVYLDYQSKTSVKLIKILAKKFWDINPEWIAGNNGFENKINKHAAGLIIGDRTFEINGKYPYTYDLASEWKSFTGLPFTFACWFAHPTIGTDTIKQFNSALKKGVNSIDSLDLSGFNRLHALKYLKNNISYKLDLEKIKSLKLFFSYL